MLIAKQSTGYAWQTIATLSEPGIETDRWIGNVCFTGSGRRAVVVYAPRQFTNTAALFQRGAFTALVDIATGAVTKVPIRSTLAYFNPGCGTGESAILTQERSPDDSNTDHANTRLTVLDTTNGTIASPIELAGQVTSAVPVGQTIVAAGGRELLEVDRSGGVHPLAATSSVPFHITADGNGGVVFMDVEGRDGVVHRLASPGAAVPGASGSRLAELARGELMSVTVRAGGNGRVFITGDIQTVTTPPPSVHLLSVPSNAEVSSEGALAILHDPRPDPGTGRAGAAEPSQAWVDAMTLDTPRNIDEPTRVRLHTRILSTSQDVRFAVTPGERASARIADGALPHPLAQIGSGGSGGMAPDATSVHDPIDPNATCAVPRNDPQSQVMQPTPRQVEWAADQAVLGALTITRPDNWNQSGLPAWSPQAMFPAVPLIGGGHVQVNVFLGILAQESNLWQASNHALSGTPGNPLVGDFYGSDLSGSVDDWVVDFSEADCGYGVTQITDGMRKAGAERPNETALPPNMQRAAALDYASNIAAGLRILQSKWNETRAAGVIASDGDPKWLENWYPAIWAYNSGFHQDKHDGSPWGLGWLNNAANPNYPANRTMFAADPHDPAHPQDWPYPEKVIGFAAYSISTPDGAGFRPAWWTDNARRLAAKPPIFAFCAESNDCFAHQEFPPTDPEVIDEPAGPCAHQNEQGLFDLQCWWHDQMTFKSCANEACGHQLLRFDPPFPEPDNGTHNPPNCTTAGLPTGSMIIDDVPASAPPVRRASDGTKCAPAFTSAGEFQLDFHAREDGTFSSKIDFHQIGGGFGGHFWFAHTRSEDHPTLKVTGKWTFNQPLNAWGRVLVHMPDVGAHTQQARYSIFDGASKIESRYALQRVMENKWVSLGVMEFHGVPSITLSSQTWNGRGTEDIAWDAVAIQPLPSKPTDFVVALGDSYTSGEGASAPGGSDYYRETDNNGELDDDKGRNACHRSPFAWPRRGRLADSTRNIGARSDDWDNELDFQNLACSGAETQNLLPNRTVENPPVNARGLEASGQYGEVSQLDKGYLNENTTLVTFSIGGNDARFSDVIRACLVPSANIPCMDLSLNGESDLIGESVPAAISGHVHQSVLQVLDQVHQRAPNAQIILMGYPRLIDDHGGCLFHTGGPFGEIGLEIDEAAWLNDTAEFLDDELSQVADEAAANGIPTTFANPIGDFAGKGVCGDPESIHGVVEDTTEGDKPKSFGLFPPSAQSFHPKISGTALYADTFDSALRRIGL